MIPTIGRVESLVRVLASLKTQICRPTHILICVSAEHEVVDATKQVVAETELETTLIVSSIRSSAIQRNILLDAWQEDHKDKPFGLFLDDDTFPAPDYASKLLGVLAGDKELGGVSGVTVSRAIPKTPRSIQKALARGFALHGDSARLLRSGVNIGPDSQRTGLIRADWLFSCSMWLQEAVHDHRFPDDWLGYAIGEDVWFSNQLTERWQLAVDPSAKLRIDEVPNRVGFTIAMDTVTHQFRIMRCRRDFRRTDMLMFWWSVIGRCTFDTFRMIRLLRYEYVLHLVGTVAGALTVVFRPTLAYGAET